MQQKVNLVELLVNGELITLEDVLVIETEDGIYVEDTFKIGTDNEGNDLIDHFQNTLFLLRLTLR